MSTTTAGPQPDASTSPVTEAEPTNTGPTNTGPTKTGPTKTGPTKTGPTKTLTRSRDRMLAGVASGIAAYLGVDAVVVRVAFVVLTLVGGLGIPLYLASWVLVPDERTRQSIVSEFTGDVRAWRD